MLKRSISLILAAAVMFCFTGCLFESKPVSEPEKEYFSKDKAREAAIAYVNEKYGDEFIEVDNIERRGSFVGNGWYSSDIIRKSQKNEKDPRKYEVSVSWDTSYTILGDTVMFEYYSALYEDYAVPIVAEEMGDIPFELVVTDIINTTHSEYGVLPDVVIPTELDDDNNIYSKKDYEFKIFIPQSYDNEAMEDISKKINERFKDNYSSAYIVVLNDDEFAELASSKDKYWECRIKHLAKRNKWYKVSE